jgi:hypothetical protein
MPLSFHGATVDLLFSGDSVVDGAETLEPNQASALVVSGKAGNTAFVMLLDSSPEITGNSAIERTTAARD